MANRPRRIQTFWTDADTVHDTATAEYTERVVKIGKPFSLGCVATVCQKAIGLEQTGRANELLRIPPPGRTLRRTAGAQDAFIQAIELVTVFGALQALYRRRNAIVDEVGPDLFELPEE